MRLILALIILFVLHHHLVVSRPYMGPNYSLGPHMWSNIRQRSTVPTVYKTIQGSRYRTAPAPKHRFNFNTRIFALEDQQPNDIVKETEAFLNNQPSYDFFPKLPKQNNKLNTFDKFSKYFEKSPSRSTTTPPPPIISMEDEEFLLRHLEEGFDLHRDFEKLLYPRKTSELFSMEGDDGFRRKRKVTTDRQKFNNNL